MERHFTLGTERQGVPRRVEESDPEGVDYGWVMQTTFVLTILVGAPAVALLSSTVELPTWGARAGFAIRVGAVVWILTAIPVAVYANVREVTDADDDGPDEQGDREGEQRTAETGPTESEAVEPADPPDGRSE